MNTVLKKNQYYLVSGLKRYRELVKQEMLLAQRSQVRSSTFIRARQKKKIYETLISMVIHEGVDDTTEFALQLYAKLPHTPQKAQVSVKACEQALESFFLLANVNPYIQKLYDQQRPATVFGKNYSTEKTIEESTKQELSSKQANLTITIHSNSPTVSYPTVSYTDTLTEHYQNWGNPP